MIIQRVLSHHPFVLTNKVIVLRGRAGGPDNNSIDKYPPHLI
jgi:hypothetical protein